MFANIFLKKKEIYKCIQIKQICNNGFLTFRQHHGSLSIQVRCIIKNKAKFLDRPFSWSVFLYFSTHKTEQNCRRALLNVMIPR